MVLQNNGMNDLAITNNGIFSFLQTLQPDDTYNVTVSSQPSVQICSVTNGSGTVGNNDITNVSVSCSVITFTINANAGPNGSINPSGAVTVNSGGSQTFTASPAGGYAVNQWILDGVPVQTGGNTYQLNNVLTDHTVNVTFGSSTVTPSVTSLALSINGGSSPLTGNPRIITITNNGNLAATNLSVAYPTWPGGTPATTASDDCGATLAPNGGFCTITVTPGQVATSNCDQAPGSLPTPDIITVTAANATQAQIGVVVLGYGCIYQSGYIFSIDDTASSAGSIRGRVIALTEQSPGIVWDSSSNCNAINQTCIPTTTNNVDIGIGNTLDIYNTLTVVNGLPANTYAAGLCFNVDIDGYTDWYLPAICELGPDVFCNPGDQRIQTNLYNTGKGAIPATLWSSTYQDTKFAWYEIFASAPGQHFKYTQIPVRCVRLLTS